MAPVTFITGSEGKFREASAIMPELRQRKIDLVEIQSLDPHAIILAKLEEARTKCEDDIVVEDTSLYLDALGGKLPGPLVKWFIQGMGGCGEAYELVRRIGQHGCEALCVVGYRSSDGTATQLCEARIRGQIVRPLTGGNGFGWDPIFQPIGSPTTFANMTLLQKNAFSHRAQAFRKLKAFHDALRGGS
jgi:non-canonical purine NTP pyrophosphatase (RdgB/HAM1 family)